jgi:hypothetical protein
MQINKKMRGMIGFVLMLVLALNFVSAGVGISWDRESSLVPEGTKTCLTYKVYNPWPEDSYVKIRLSDDLMDILSSADAERKFVPAETSSEEAIPVTFCFRTPTVYEKDCSLFGSLLCEQTCGEEMKNFRGEVEVIEINEEEMKKGGSGGSKTQMSVSAPINIKVQCLAHKRNYSLVYALIALIAGILLAVNILKKRKFAKGSSKKKTKKGE